MGAQRRVRARFEWRFREVDLPGKVWTMKTVLKNWSSSLVWMLLITLSSSTVIMPKQFVKGVSGASSGRVTEANFT